MVVKEANLKGSCSVVWVFGDGASFGLGVVKKLEF